MLITTRTLIANMIYNLKGKNMMLLKILNHLTGKKSNKQTGFNDVTWGLVTWNNVKLI